MKTSIQIPIPIYESAEQLAAQLDIDLNELYTVAISAYISAWQKDNVTEALNRVYATTSSEIEPGLMDIQLKTIGEQW